jgi:hypothetical protein
VPSRLLREGILDSTAVNELSFPAEVFYRRLMSVVDDFGRFDGRPAVLRGRLYSLKLDTVREAEISRWIAECEKAGLIVLYTVGGKPYILFDKLGSPRAKESKYPAPPSQAAPDTGQRASVNGCAQTRTDANTCAQVKTDAPYSGSGSGPNSGSGPTSGAAAEPPEPGPSDGRTEPNFDPLRADQEGRKLFERRWREAGLRRFSRLDKSLWGLLAQLLADPWWAEHYPAALERAGRIPFLRDGAGRHKGAMDVSEFLRDPDLCRKIVDGVHDPHAPPQRAGGGGGKPGSLTERAADSFAEFLGQGGPDE